MAVNFSRGIFRITLLVSIGVAVFFGLIHYDNIRSDYRELKRIKAIHETDAYVSTLELTRKYNKPPWELYGLEWRQRSKLNQLQDSLNGLNIYFMLDPLVELTELYADSIIREKRYVDVMGRENLNPSEEDKVKEEIFKANWDADNKDRGLQLKFKREKLQSMIGFAALWTLAASLVPWMIFWMVLFVFNGFKKN